MMMNSNCETTDGQLTKLFLEGRVTVLTGAGVSTESGLPDFRGREGLWTGTDLLELLSAEGIKAHPEEFADFCRKAIHEVESHQPNMIHQMLAHLQQVRLVQTIITQNVDGYHQAAGATNVLEVHGNLRRLRCDACEKRFEPTAGRTLGEACGCGGALRSDIVLFGEMLPKEVYASAVNALMDTDLLVIMGTTLQVAPVSEAPALVKANGGKVAIFNNEPTDWDAIADFKQTGQLSRKMRAFYQFLIKYDRGAHGIAPAQALS